MGKIKIFERNAFAREALEQVLEENQLGDQCEVVDSEDKNQDIHILIKETEDVSPIPLDIKAIDQFSKPLRIGALLDRIHRHISALKNAETDIMISIGLYQLDTQNNLFTGANGANIRLTDKETHILRYLHAQGGDFVERRALLDEVWGYAETAETHTLETHIYRLRQKIEKDPANPQILVTSGQGYLLSQ